MSKINDLIRELCPNGVEYKKLNDVCEKIYAGGTPKTNNESYYNGDIKWLRSGEINFNEIYDTEIRITDEGLNNSSAKLIPKHSVVIAMTGATVARTAMIMDDMSMNQSVCALIPIKDLNYRFLYQCLANQYKELKSSGQGVLTSLNIDRIKKIIIPVPPIEVQEEIVRILDKFDELEAELEAELEVRKNQYEFWREKLLNSEENIVSLNCICNGIFSGKCTSRDKNGSYPVYGSTGIIAKTNKYSFDSPKILVARVGANAGYVHIASGQYDVTDNTLIVDLKENINQKYIYYYLQNYKLNKLAKGGGQPLITGKQLKELNISLPSLVIQNKIVNSLNKFDKLINDISVGLPAEIELRRKQYEYYRNKLLSFEELKNE